MTPNDALLVRVQTLEGFLRGVRRNELKFSKLSEMARGAGSCELRFLSDAPLFTWRQDLLNAAVSAAASVPSPITVTADLMPSESGIYLFDDAVSFQGASVPVRAVGWYTVVEFVFVFLYTPTSGTAWTEWGPLMAFANFMLKQGVDVEQTDGVDIREKTRTDFDLNVGGSAAVRFLLSSWLWLKQRVLSHVSGSVSGAARKQAARVSASAAVNVVVLRRSENTAGVTTNRDSGYEFSCQWLVRGHWRQQYFPSTATHRPLWIEPYVKGPDDKPFKGPAETVFVVNR